MSAQLYDLIAPENAAEVEAHCVRTLFERARQGTLFAPLGTLFIFWVAHDPAALVLGIAWMIVNSLPDALTFLYTSRLLKHPPAPEHIAAHHRRQVVLRTIQGLCWGSAAIVFHAAGPQGAITDMIVLLVLVSISAVSVVNMAPSFRTLAAFSASLLLVPMLYYFSLGDTTHLQIAVGLCILLGVEMQFGWDAYRQFAGGVHQLVLNQKTQRQLELRNAELDELNSKLRVLAIHDQLTGLYNRRYMLEQLERQREQFERHGSACSLVLFDIDHFKDINDTHGHAVGDEVLVAFSRRVEGLLRMGDSLGRYGGEEFLLLLPMTGLAPATQLAERVRSALADTPLIEHGGPITVTASFGLAQLLPGENIAAWLQRADQALYRAKDSGRNCVMA